MAIPIDILLSGINTDLRAVTQDSMLQFYRTHYVPNNATLVVVGDVDFDEVYNEAQRCFERFPLLQLTNKRNLFITLILVVLRLYLS